MRETAAQIDKSTDAIVVALACLRAGAALLPLNAAYTLAELGYFLGDAEPALTLCRPEQLSSTRELASRLGLESVESLGVARDGTFAEWIAAAPSAGRGRAPVVATLLAHVGRMRNSEARGSAPHGPKLRRRGACFEKSGNCFLPIKIHLVALLAQQRLDCTDVVRQAPERSRSGRENHDVAGHGTRDELVADDAGHIIRSRTARSCTTSAISARLRHMRRITYALNAA